MPIEAHPLDRLPREGEILAGRYRIGRALGRGAMGIVVEAQHLHLGERVAIKFMTAERRGDPRAIARFREEARSARQLQSPHIVRIHEFDALDDGVPYMIMEFLPGMDLGRRLAHFGPAPLEQAVDWVVQACEGVTEAHRRGIVHRDLKPANLFLFEREEGDAIIKVLDFGISKNVTGVARTLDVGMPKAASTGDNTFLGSAPYMSPEQMSSAGEVDLRTDIWSLGVTLFQLITGEFPFPGQDHLQIYKAILVDPKTWPDRLGRARELAPILAKCFEIERARRYRAVSELVRDLKPFAPTPRHEIAPPSSRTSTLPSAVTPRPRPAPQYAPSGPIASVRARIWAAGLAIVLAFTVGEVVAARLRGPVRTSSFALSPSAVPVPSSGSLPGSTAAPVSMAVPSVAMPTEPLAANVTPPPSTPGAKGSSEAIGITNLRDAQESSAGHVRRDPPAAEPRRYYASAGLGAPSSVARTPALADAQPTSAATAPTAAASAPNPSDASARNDDVLFGSQK